MYPSVVAAPLHAARIPAKRVPLPFAQLIEPPTPCAAVYSLTKYKVSESLAWFCQILSFPNDVVEPIPTFPALVST